MRDSTPMDKLLQTRLQQVKNAPVQSWARRMIREWSRNEATSMLIASLAHYYDRLILLEQEAASAEPVIETGNGSLKKNPVFTMLDECQAKILSFSRQLNIEPDVIFDEEQYE